MDEKISVVGLGYVGLPLAHALGRRFASVVGFDISQRRIAELQRGIDSTGEIAPADLGQAKLHYSTDPAAMRGSSFFIVTVPTPIDSNRQPDLTAVRHACETVGSVLSPGGVVVFESTVYPGVTEEICGPILARISGLRQGTDFTLGYSPERINPGDKEHTIERIVKVVSGEDAATLERVAAVYGRIIDAGLHRAPSIKVAEAAKVIENTQRDLNIALMNELALIFDRLGLRTKDVLEAAGTKWNFLRFTPGLVGGHCIGVDPYYLTARAQMFGYHPEVILAGRRINDSMGQFIAQKLVKMLSRAGCTVRGARVGVLGLTFKENIRDLRNSRVPDIVQELDAFGIEAKVYDPLADPEAAREEYGIALVPAEALERMDALVLAVPHDQVRDLVKTRLSAVLREGGTIIDVKSALQPGELPLGTRYWSL
jgi:UDP-N-acetyl-D-galactosamine dehydrogenase